MLCGPILGGSDVYRAKMTVQGPSGLSSCDSQLSLAWDVEANREHGGGSAPRVSLASVSSYYTYYRSLYLSPRKITAFDNGLGRNLDAAWS